MGLAKETIMKGLLEAAMMAVSGVICVAASKVMVGKALAPLAATSAAAPAAGHAAPAPTAAEGHGAPAPAGGHGAPAAAGSASSGAGATYPLKTAVVNLAQDSDHRFAKVSLTLELQDAAAVEELKGLDHQVYDTLIEVLGNVRAQDLATDEGKERLKADILLRLNHLLPVPKVKSVFLTEFLVQ